MITNDTKVDSPEGIVHLVRWARAHGAVLYPAHEKIAIKHGVSMDGVIISRPIPVSGRIYAERR